MERPWRGTGPCPGVGAGRGNTQSSQREEDQGVEAKHSGCGGARSARATPILALARRRFE